MKLSCGLFGLIFTVALVGAAVREDSDINQKGCVLPCGYTPPGQRPCCVSSSAAPSPVTPACYLRSSYYCPCDCVSSTTTVCPPPDVPVPPCPVYCCESSSSSSTTCHQPCPWRRVPVPRPFLACKSSSSSSSSSSCGCVHACRHRQYYGRFPKAAETPELTGQEVYEKFHNAQVLAHGRNSCSSSSVICDKKKALHTVFELDKKFVKYVNQQNLPALYKLITPNARYAMNQPLADAEGCARVTGPLSQYLPDYIGLQLTTVFQDIVYNQDQSVTIHVLDVLTSGTSTLIVQDVWRTYKSYQACNYKIDYLNGSNWVCK